MGSSNSTLDKHVVYVHLYIFFDLVFEDFVHEVLVSDTYFFHTKWHNPVIEKSPINHKNSFFFIFRDHPNLVVSIEGIYEAE